ncbi:hypothetical protein SynPROSU1_00129 [Synechococcus sp. PROS-U-1]|nr:hypothetical protein SynPROSU1_00129 [Synechococcus sp. PROS-U-1]
MPSLSKFLIIILQAGINWTKQPDKAKNTNQIKLTIATMSLIYFSQIKNKKGG